jgi:DNA-binding MarR family transcriptional regulator
MSTRPNRNSDPALRLVELFPSFQHAFSRWIHSLIESTSVSPGRIRLVGVLHCKGAKMMSGLSDELGVTPRNVTTLVDGLESEGLVRRAPHPTDRRVTMIELTPQGTKLAADIFASYQGKIAELFRELPAGDQRELLRMMETLVGALRQRGQEAGPGCPKAGLAEPS